MAQTLDAYNSEMNTSVSSLNISGARTWQYRKAEISQKLHFLKSSGKLAVFPLNLHTNAPNG